VANPDCKKCGGKGWYTEPLMGLDGRSTGLDADWHCEKCDELDKSIKVMELQDGK